jgi:hypothetical protein
MPPRSTSTSSTARKPGINEAIVGDTEIAGLTYNVAGDNRLGLLATSAFPEFRKQGDSDYP